MLKGRQILPPILQLYAIPTPQLLLLALAATSPAHLVPWLITENSRILVYNVNTDLHI